AARAEPPAAQGPPAPPASPRDELQRTLSHRLPLMPEQGERYTPRARRVARWPARRLARASAARALRRRLCTRLYRSKRPGLPHGCGPAQAAAPARAQGPPAQCRAAAKPEHAEDRPQRPEVPEA